MIDYPVCQSYGWVSLRTSAPEKVATEIVQCEGEEDELESTVMVLPWEHIDGYGWCRPFLSLWFYVSPNFWRNSAGCPSE